jgi:lysozyme
MAEADARPWPEADAILALAVPLVKKWEGLRLAPYRCPTGHATIGWGTRTYPGGEPVDMSDPPIGEPEADELLAAALGETWDRLKPLLARAPTAHQAAALVSLGYNIGVGIHDGLKGDLADSALLAKFNAGNVRGAAGEFPKWCHGRVKGKLIVIGGLLRRREDEAALFLTPDAVS